MTTNFTWTKTELFSLQSGEFNVLVAVNNGHASWSVTDHSGNTWGSGSSNSAEDAKTTAEHCLQLALKARAG